MHTNAGQRLGTDTLSSHRRMLYVRGCFIVSVTVLHHRNDMTVSPPGMFIRDMEGNEGLGWASTWTNQTLKLYLHVVYNMLIVS